MKKSIMQRCVALLLAAAVSASVIGCGSGSGNGEVINEETVSETLPETQEESGDEQEEAPDFTETASPEETADIQEIEQTESAFSGMTDEQRNSYSMLFYLAVTAEEIRESRDNRLILDDIYSSLLNDINPSAIDETTQQHLVSLRDIIKDYMNISIKRERLQYIYNQDKARAMRSLVPNPLAILSMAHSLDWRRMAMTAVYTVVDSVRNYRNASDAADQEFLMSGWELDDEERATIQRNRERAFDYMVDMVQEYDLDGTLTLNEEAIERFANICASESLSLQEKIRRLVSEEETYQLFGNYWLELADCYFQNSDYPACIESVEEYRALSTGIFRRDTDYAQILPEAIVAAQNVYSGEEYISNVRSLTDDLMRNTSTEDWSLRYFAAQVYLDLYNRTYDEQYLSNAYNIAYDNVTVLLDEQRALNQAYMAEVQEVEVTEPDYRFMTEDEEEEAKREYREERRQARDYNRSLRETRKTELPTLYEPLILNCDLLFALADEMNISQREQEEIEAILQTETNGIFISRPINERYSFSELSEDYSIEFDSDEILIPADLLTTGARVSVIITDHGTDTLIDDYEITKVKREGSTLDTFIAHYSSDSIRDYEWTEESEITVSIVNGNEDDPLVFHFRVAEMNVRFWIIPDELIFEEV